MKVIINPDLVSKVIEIERHKQGLRVRFLGQRIHHGASSLMVAGGLACFRRTRPFSAVLLLGAIHDRHDWKLWFAPGAQR